MFWRRRSRDIVVKDNDRNTRYFHQKASMRKRKNRLVGLRDLNGIMQEDSQNMEQIVMECFKNLF
jgi:hypothetical protein